MPGNKLNKKASCALLVSLLAAGHCMAADSIETLVNATVEPLMRQQQIPGLVIAITVKGQPRFFSYGVASKEAGTPVTQDTLFEIGSLSKTFTATLAAYAQATGKLSLPEKAGEILPTLRGSAFDGISVLQLGTYSAGGLPLQFPGEADAADRMLDYFKNWQPVYPAGTHRQYSNPSLGLFGYLAAQRMGAPFDEVMMKTVLPRLGLKHTWLKVPADQMGLYAQGYNKNDQPVRVGPGALDSQAYGIKTSAADLIRYVQVNLQPTGLEASMQMAIATTHTGYYKVGEMTQGLGWEIYPYPVTLEQLLAGNSTSMAMEPHTVEWLNPPQLRPDQALYNKTGSTGGFGAYAAYVPPEDIGIVILANKNFPIPERIKIAHQLLTTLSQQPESK